MFCKKCGNEVPKEAKFCTRCGEPVNNHKPVVEHTEESNVKNDEIKQSEEPKENKKRKKKKKKIAFGRILLFLIVVFVVWCVLASQFHMGIWLPEGNEETAYEAEESGLEVGIVYSLDNF